MKTLFYNQQESRLRAGWRIVIFLFAFALIGGGAIQGIKHLFFPEITKRAFLEQYSVLLVGCLAVSASLLVPLASRVLDHRSWLSLGLGARKEAWKDLGFGLLLSAAMAGLFFLTVWSLGYIRFDAIEWAGMRGPAENGGFTSMMATFSLASMAVLLLEMTLVGWWEELVFRGYVFQNMRQGLGHVPAIVISCLIYGLIHWSNPNAGWLSSLIIVGFGYLRLYGYLSTGKLWLSIGMHIGWNFFQGPIFGFAASGHAHATFFQQVPSGPPSLSGGSFGPEGSLLMLPVLALALAAMRWWSQRTAVHGQGGK